MSAEVQAVGESALSVSHTAENCTFQEMPVRVPFDQIVLRAVCQGFHSLPTVLDARYNDDGQVGFAFT
jgi:hypothetical protein